MPRARTLTVLAALGVALGLGPAGGLSGTASASHCPTATPPAWFIGVVYDAALRADFQADVVHFEAYLAKLREVYCIPDAQAKILAFQGFESVPFGPTGKTYTAATEPNVKGAIQGFASAASAHANAVLFYFQSSHGLVYDSFNPCGPSAGTRLLGSFAQLGAVGAGQDGVFHDCELGNALAQYEDHVRMVVAVDCSFCGGFSDSLTAVSGTVPDGQTPRGAGVVAPNRIVITGCAETTECFGDCDAGCLFAHMRSALDSDVAGLDGWSAPGFPLVQGIDAPVRGAPFNAPDGVATMSEWFFAAVASAYTEPDPISIQQQFRIKYGFASLAEDIRVG